MKKIILPIALVIPLLFLSGFASTLTHVMESKTGHLKPEPGYSWVYPDSQHDLSVRWEPGKAYWYNDKNQWPHIIASTTEGSWNPEPGYVWSNLDQNGKPIPGNLAVHWKPGIAYIYLSSIKWPHVIASTTEGSWKPEPGYSWVYPDSQSDWSVRWEPGIAYIYLSSIKWPHVIASSTEGSWQPESGYEWAHLDSAGNPIPGDLTVISTSERRASMDRMKVLNDHWAKYLKEIQTDRAYPNWSAPPHDLWSQRK